MTLSSTDRRPASVSPAERRTLVRAGYRIGVQAALDALRRRSIADRLAHTRTVADDRTTAPPAEGPTVTYQQSRRDITGEPDTTPEVLLRAAIRAGIASEVADAATAHYNKTDTPDSQQTWITAAAHTDAWNSVLEDAGVDLDELYDYLDVDTGSDPDVDAIVSDPDPEVARDAAAMADTQADVVAGIRPGTDVTLAELAAPGAAETAEQTAAVGAGRAAPSVAAEYTAGTDQGAEL